MIFIDVQQAQADLLRYLEQAAQGETIVVCRENRPLAAIRPVPPYPEGPRPIGLAEGTGEVLPSFFEPWPPELLAAFEGEEKSWEIGVQYSLGRLTLQHPPSLFVPSQRVQHQINLLLLTEEAALHVPNLPPLHRDPFDRMLICQAIKESLLILTPDPMIR